MINNLLIPLVYKLYIYFPNKKILIRYTNMKYRLPYHVVELRPWPITSAIRAIFIALGLINLFHLNNPTLLLLGRSSILLSIFQWWQDVIREATYIGKHTLRTQAGLKLGIILFIIREICFFLAFFEHFSITGFHPQYKLAVLDPLQVLIPLIP